VDARVWLATARTDAGQLTGAESICRSLLLIGGLSESRIAWIQAALTRVLLWQERVPEALALPSAQFSSGATDEETEAFVRSTDVRLQLAAGRVFAAGVAAGDLLALTSAAPPVARLIALTSHLRVIAAAGDLGGARARMSEIVAAARAARSPLRLARARLIWAHALRTAGRGIEADRQYRLLVRVARAAPPLLRHHLHQQLTSRVGSHANQGDAPLMVGDGERDRAAAVLVRLAQDEDDDGRAIERLMEATAKRLRATRIDLWSGDAGPATVVRSVGTGLPSTIGGRVLDAGIAIGPQSADPPRQVGVPIRLGSRLIGALVARWPVDRAFRPTHMTHLICSRRSPPAALTHCCTARGRRPRPLP
jgi:hypothetical protein